MANEKWLIDANALLHDTVWLCGGFVGDPYCDGYMEALDKVEAVVREFPKVDAVEVVHGRWISHEYDMAYSCSNCGYITDWHLSYYCPHCGAKMDGDGNG